MDATEQYTRERIALRRAASVIEDWRKSGFADPDRMNALDAALVGALWINDTTPKPTAAPVNAAAPHSEGD